MLPAMLQDESSGPHRGGVEIEFEAPDGKLEIAAKTGR